LWGVEKNPALGGELPGMNKDPRFPESAGFKKCRLSINFLMVQTSIFIINIIHIQEKHMI
jgi:hypothetical protein